MSSNESRADLLELIVRVRTQCPEFRFGQLLATIGLLAEDETGHSLWDVEDAEFLTALERFAADLARRGMDVNEPIIATDGSESPIPLQETRDMGSP